MHPRRRMRNMNMSQFNVPSVSVCESSHLAFLLAFLDVLRKPWQQHCACPSKWLHVTFQSRKQMAKALWASKKKKKKSDARKNRGICECDFLTLPFFSLTVFPCFCICAFVCFSCSYGQFWGRWTRSVGLSGRGRRYPGAAHSQLPPTASYLVQGRAQNPTQQSHVSTLFPFVSFCALYLFLYVFDPVNPFQCFVCSWGCFSLRVPVPACRLSFITLHSVLKPSLNFSCTTRSKTKTVLALCEMNSPLFVPLLFFFL